MKIGRNDPCICGSGKKYKKCCRGRVKTEEAYIDFDGFFPRVGGFDSMPDAKAMLEKELVRHMFDRNVDVNVLVNNVMVEYNNKVDNVSQKLQRPYGGMLNEITNLLVEKNYNQAIDQARLILKAFPESVEACTLLDRAQWETHT